MYSNIEIDGLLSSQIGNRNRGTTSARYELIDSANKPDEAATELLQDSIAFKNILKAIVETPYYGNTVIEYDVNNFDALTGVLIDRRHILPENGIFREQIYQREGIAYREVAEYGVTILEFGTKYEVGLLNKAVPHVLMKKFAMGCFSEFAERFGMPIPIVKTNTEDQTMINRIQSMLADMGSSAGMILDNSEMFELGTAITSDGALYETLVRMLNNEISMLISGAVIGQDTKNGNESKEALSIQILEGLIKEDRTNTATAINTTALPALVAQGIIKDGLRFRFCEEEDLDALWAKVAAAMPFFDIEPEFINKKFGIPVQPKAVNF
jgi:phage gp29-like protein